MDIIRQLPRFDDCPYLVPNPKTKKPYTDIKHPWQTARRLARLDDVHVHDLRHTFASAAAQANVSLFTIGRVLGHANLASSARYSHLSGNTLLAAVEAGAARLDADWAGG